MSLQITRRVPSSWVVFHLSGGGARGQLDLGYRRWDAFQRVPFQLFENG